MAFTVANVLAEVRESFPGFYLDADPRALAIVNKAQIDLMRIVDLYPYEEVYIPLVSGTREYAVSNLVRIVSARYEASANESIPLRETTVDRLDTDYKAWRSFPMRGRPYQYYRQGGRIGFPTIPDATTGVTYPRVALTSLLRHDFTAATDLLPSHIDKIDAYVMATCLHYCLRFDFDKVPAYAQMADAAARDLQSFERRVLVREKDQVRVDIPYPTTR